MKNIAICFDGTWNTADAAFPTNVVKTAAMVKPTNDKSTPQVVFYDPGVGSTRVAFGTTINKLLGGAFGAGLMDNIERAYRFLTFNYAPGDRLFIFGFSRGAFGARSFGGLVRTCGVLRRNNIGQVKEVINVYRNRDPNDPLKADAPACVKFRRENSVASFRGGAGGERQLHSLTIEYMGIWDTVGSLGVPANFLFASYFNRKYLFHNQELSSMVKSARHAVSIDERRRTFAPTLWDNLGERNANAIPAVANMPPYQQAWFPGDHASVGGGGDVNGLWQASLVWVVEGAQLLGLGMDETLLNEYRRDIDYTKSVNSMRKPAFSLSSLSARRWRDGPNGSALADVADIAQLRIKATADDLDERQFYRPQSLKTFAGKFAGQLGITWQ